MQVYCIVCKDVEGWSLPMGQGIAGYVAKSGHAVNIPNAYEDSRYAIAIRNLLIPCLFKQCFAAPLLFRGCTSALHSFAGWLVGRFDSSWDRKSGYRTISVLCMPGNPFLLTLISQSHSFSLIAMRSQGQEWQHDCRDSGAEQASARSESANWHRHSIDQCAR